MSDHMAAVRRSRPDDPAPEGPRCPVDGIYLWNIFVDLHGARSAGMVPNAIGWTDMDAYSRLMDTPLQPWEVRAIRELDRVYISVRAEQPQEHRA